MKNNNRQVMIIFMLFYFIGEGIIFIVIFYFQKCVGGSRNFSSSLLSNSSIFIHFASNIFFNITILPSCKTRPDPTHQRGQGFAFSTINTQTRGLSPHVHIQESFSSENLPSLREAREPSLFKMRAKVKRFSFHYYSSFFHYRPLFFVFVDFLFVLIIAILFLFYFTCSELFRI